MKKEHRRIWFCIELKRHKVTLKPQRSFSVRKSFVVPIIVHITESIMLCLQFIIEVLRHLFFIII